jgi:hypothetical protein
LTLSQAVSLLAGGRRLSDGGHLRPDRRRGSTAVRQ